MSGKRILLSHGDGAGMTRNLISGLFHKHFQGAELGKMDDGAVLTSRPECDIVFTTDSYVVKPIFFPGGDIGKLAICGTVNDLAVMGAVPQYISCGFIIEEGFEMEKLERVVATMGAMVRETGVTVAAGDTKVVERGSADGLFINTSGIGFRPKGLKLGVDEILPGDVLLVNGHLGNHGMAILAARESIPFNAVIESDCAPLNNLISDMMKEENAIHFMRDLTRGGLAVCVNEMVETEKFGIDIDEEKIPVDPSVRRLCEILGIDPLHLANEGRAIFAVSQDKADELLTKMKTHPLGKSACIVGRVSENHPGKAAVRTGIGGIRILDVPAGGPLPRIC